MTVTGSSLAPELCGMQRDNHGDTEKRKIQSQMSSGGEHVAEGFPACPRCLPSPVRGSLPGWPMRCSLPISLFCSMFPSSRMSYILGWPMERIPWLCWGWGQLSCHFLPTNHVQIVAGTLCRKKKQPHRELSFKIAFKFNSG